MALATGLGVMLGASAWACTGLATLSSSPLPPSGQSAGRMGVRGEGFRPGGEEVAVHADDPNGEVLVSARPDASGVISAAVDVGRLGGGDHVLVATQPAPGQLGQMLAKLPVSVHTSVVTVDNRPDLRHAIPWVVAGLIGLLSMPLLPPAMALLTTGLARRKPNLLHRGL
jgi:hypothetical protein